METPKMVVFVVKRYAVREAKTWRYAVRKAKIGRYAVRKGGWGVTLILRRVKDASCNIWAKNQLFLKCLYRMSNGN